MKTLLGLVFSLAIWFNANGQSIYFPKGNTLDLVTAKDVLYFDTDIRFTTRNSVSSDYRWAIVFDSIDTHWDLSMCANGECLIGIPATGNFIRDFGDNDTTVYVRFHVYTNEWVGKSRIKVKVTHTTQPNVTDTLDFTITYTNSTGTYEAHAIKIDYTIVNTTLQVNNNGVKQLNLYNLLGQRVANSQTSQLQMPEKRGLYILTVLFENGTQSTQKVVW